MNVNCRRTKVYTWTTRIKRERIILYHFWIQDYPSLVRLYRAQPHVYFICSIKQMTEWGYFFHRPVQPIKKAVYVHCRAFRHVTENCPTNNGTFYRFVFHTSPPPSSRTWLFCVAPLVPLYKLQEQEWAEPDRCCWPCSCFHSHVCSHGRDAPCYVIEHISE